jgi:hypothetical protein
MSFAAVAEMSPKHQEHFQEILKMASGQWVSQCLYVAVALEIPDLLKDGPVPVSELAQQAKADEDYLYRVLRALCGLGLFTEHEGRLFMNSPLSASLCKDAPFSARGMAMLLGQKEHYEPWGHLLESVRKGDRPFEAVYGMPVFEFYAKHPEASEVFNDAMTSFASNLHRSVLSTYDFSGFKTLVDIGGGHGALIMSILEKFPALNGVLFDMQHVIDGVKIPETLKGRIQAIGGNFFESAPAGDAYILSTVIHDWSHELSLKILKQIHNSMADGGTLLVVDHVVTGDNQFHPGKLLDINMLVMTEGGRERTREEFQRLYDEAGFELTRILPLPSGSCVVEGRKR